MNSDQQIINLRSWKESSSTVRKVLHDLFLNLAKNFNFLLKFGANKKYFITITLFNFLNIFLSGLGIVLLLPVARGLISNDFKTIFESKYFAFLLDYLPSINNFSNTLLLIILISLVLLTMILKSVVEYFSNIYETQKEQQVHNNVSRYIFEKYLGYGLKFYDLTSSSKNHINLTKTPMILQEVLVLIRTTLKIIIESAMLLSIIFLLSIPFGFLALATIPLYILITKFFNDRLKSLLKEDDIIELENSSVTLDYFQRIPLMKAYGAENFEFNKYYNIIENRSRRKLKIQKLLSLQKPFSEIITIFILFIFILTLSFYSGVNGGAENLPIYLVIFYTFQRLIKKATELSSRSLKINQKLGLLYVCMSEIESDQEYKVSSGHMELSDDIQNIEYKNLTFGYVNNKKTLEAFSLSVKKNEKVLILGKNGSGKSTMVSLLLRFYECPKNSLFINGTDIHSFSVESIRKNVAFVSQDAYVFKDTLRNNILYGLDFDLSDDEWKILLENADMETFFKKLPNGLDTMIGERGANLSGGEKQRIAIARALLRKAPIVIMDEPTSSLDVVAEEKFNKYLSESFDNKIVIVITHKAKLAKDFDKIAVIDKGKVVQEGTYEELKNENGFFKKLYQNQRIYNHNNEKK